MELEPGSVLPLLAQRDAALLIEHIESYVAGEHLSAVHTVSPEATWFPGHFPEDPVVPGVVQIEALMQASGLLALATDPDLAEGRARLLLMGLDRVRFRRRVGPGDRMLLQVKVVSRRGPVWKVDGTVVVAGEVATEARLLLNATTADAR